MVRKRPDTAGRGEIHCSVVAGQPQFRRCVAHYPLKLVAPRVHRQSAVAHTASASKTPALPPNVVGPAPMAVYMLTYGGGVVYGDMIDLDITVDTGAALTLLTQGSTKVFRHRPGHTRPPTATAIVNQTATPAVDGCSHCEENELGAPLKAVDDQLDYSASRLTAHVAAGAYLVLLPSPVTCFKDSRFVQHQTFHLEDPTASLVLLDWVTSGRMSRGESWQFELYSSTNLVYLGEKSKPNSSDDSNEHSSVEAEADRAHHSHPHRRLVLKDVVHLSDRFLPPVVKEKQPKPQTKTDLSSAPTSDFPSLQEQTTPPSSPDAAADHFQRDFVPRYGARMDPYACYAMLVLVGVNLAPLIDSLTAMHQSNKISAVLPRKDHHHRPQQHDRQNKSAEPVLYTLSPLDIGSNCPGIILRVSAPTTEEIGDWIRVHLADLEKVVGRNIWKSAFV
ncbi:hypothetical protein IWQ60_003948 [Tieghemiomyces parasiticus]|uniref:Urease accessory protein UreD n=1 Tax=Tieghemiomyces parasiticus TaxID=78921 RepID=A0A9W8AEK6_9FUNG|nr:hypothetical protein IWQ60_003948 [Tieghemiomyces parasiticus]